MKLREWEELPAFMKCDEVKIYYDILAKKRISLTLKRTFDVIVAIIICGLFYIF